MNHTLANDTQTVIRELSLAVKYASNTDDEDPEENTLLRKKIHQICWDVTERWVSRLIDNWVDTNINTAIDNTNDHSDHNNSDNELVDDSDHNCNEIDSQSDDEVCERYITESEMLDYILNDKYIHSGDVDTVRFDDGRYLHIPPGYENVIEPFNQIFDCKIGFRLLKWRQTVTNLTISFFVPIFKKPIVKLKPSKQHDCPVEGLDGEQWNYGKDHFNMMMKNIFQYFDALQHVTIEIKVPSDTLKLSANQENVSASRADDTIEDFVFTHELWMDLCQQEFKKHFNEMIGAFRRLKTPIWGIRFGYKITVGRLKGNNVISLYDYLKHTHINNLDAEIVTKYQRSTAIPVELNLHVNNGTKKQLQSLDGDNSTIISDTELRKKDWDKKGKACNNYCDNLQMMKHILVLCVKDRKCDICQTAVTGELLVAVIDEEDI